jgi:hypothetical protein
LLVFPHPARKQTAILARQFELAELARKDTARPRLTVEISGYQPPDSGQMGGDVTFTLRNAGHVGFRVTFVQTQSGNTQNPILICSIEVHPSYPTTKVVAKVQLPSIFNPPTLKAWFGIETPDVKRRHAAEWEMRRGQFELLKSELDEV